MRRGGVGKWDVVARYRTRWETTAKHVAERRGANEMRCDGMGREGKAMGERERNGVDGGVGKGWG